MSKTIFRPDTTDYRSSDPNLCQFAADWGNGEWDFELPGDDDAKVRADIFPGVDLGPGFCATFRPPPSATWSIPLVDYIKLCKPELEFTHPGLFPFDQPLSVPPSLRPENLSGPYAATMLATYGTLGPQCPQGVFPLRFEDVPLPVSTCPSSSPPPPEPTPLSPGFPSGEVPPPSSIFGLHDESLVQLAASALVSLGSPVLHVSPPDPVGVPQFPCDLLPPLGKFDRLDYRTAASLTTHHDAFLHAYSALLRPPVSVLIMSTGSGDDIIRLSKLGVDCASIDCVGVTGLSNHAAKALKSLTATSRINLGSVLGVPFDWYSMYDLVLCHNGLNPLLSRSPGPAIFRHIVSRLNPKGRFMCDTVDHSPDSLRLAFVSQSPESSIAHIFRGVRSLSVGDIREVLSPDTIIVHFPGRGAFKRCNADGTLASIPSKLSPKGRYLDIVTYYEIRVHYNEFFIPRHFSRRLSCRYSIPLGLVPKGCCSFSAIKGLPCFRSVYDTYLGPKLFSQKVRGLMAKVSATTQGIYTLLEGSAAFFDPVARDGFPDIHLQCVLSRGRLHLDDPVYLGPHTPRDFLHRSLMVKGMVHYDPLFEYISIPERSCFPDPTWTDGCVVRRWDNPSSLFPSSVFPVFHSLDPPLGGSMRMQDFIIASSDHTGISPFRMVATRYGMPPEWIVEQGKLDPAQRLW